MKKSREFVDSLDKNDNIGAEKVFKDVMVQKVGDTLETKRQEVAKTFVNQFKDMESDVNDE